MPTYSATYEIPDDMQNTINAHTVGLGGVGIIGGIAGPHADLPIIALSWVTMTVDIAEKAGHEMDKQTAKKICAAVATAAGAMITGTKIAGSALGWIGAVFTGGASLVALAVANATLNAALTRSYGKACAMYFLQAEKIDTTYVVAMVLLKMLLKTMGLIASNEIITEIVEAERNSHVEEALRAT
jgi:uncharacterized protein (DUF697 family)